MATHVRLSLCQAVICAAGVAFGEANLGASDHFVPDGRSTHEIVDAYAERYDWTRGCSPTAAAIVFSYADNYYINYGALIKWYKIEYDTITSRYNNVPQVLDWLADAMGTDSSGGTSPGNIHAGIMNVANRTDSNYYFVVMLSIRSKLSLTAGRMIMTGAGVQSPKRSMPAALLYGP
jgi:hypothetical protein